MIDVTDRLMVRVRVRVRARVRVWVRVWVRVRVRVRVADGRWPMWTVADGEFWPSAIGHRQRADGGTHSHDER